jgi:phosphoribosylformimino-5-aminoimidazole carboxamide ribotide isomerase
VGFEIIPAIDLLDGAVVRLRQGKRDAVTIYSRDPVAFARQFEQAGARRLHVVDLNGAFDGTSGHGPLIEAICASTSMRVDVGGGVRSVDAARRLWDLGAAEVVVGTRAVSDPELLDALVAERPEGLVVGIDAKDGFVATHGWVQASEARAVDFARELAARGVRRIVFTDIATDGMLTGPNLPAQREMARAVPGVEIVASGGVASEADVLALADLGEPNLVGVIAGRAIYDGTLDLAQAVHSLALRAGV